MMFLMKLWTNGMEHGNFQITGQVRYVNDRVDHLLHSSDTGEVLSCFLRFVDARLKGLGKSVGAR